MKTTYSRPTYKHILPPLSFTQCFKEGKIDMRLYHMYRKRKKRMQEREEEILRLASSLAEKNSSTKVIHSSQPRRRTYSRSVKKHHIYYRKENGETAILTPRDTTWYKLYLQSEPTNGRLAAIFRNRFRMPYSCFMSLAKELQESPMFRRYNSLDCIGVPSIDIRLLLLGTLRYMSRSFTFDDLEEATAISRESHRLFFYTFIKYGSTHLYKKHVTDKAKQYFNSSDMKCFSIAGFNGCVGSTDAIHIEMLSCPTWTNIRHKSYKLQNPARSYNVTVSHERQILHCTQGHPATYNDKSIINSDPFYNNIKDGKTFSKKDFTLFEYDSEGNVVEAHYKGGWLMVDNGYMDWSCTIPPMKKSLSYKFIRFSEWLESMRKNVECTFGVMKKRFGILKAGSRLFSMNSCDEIFLTCCSLHNMLLFEDNLDEWDLDDVQNANNNRFALNRLENPSFDCFINNETIEVEEYFTSRDQYNVKKATIHGKRWVHKLSYKTFYKLLVQHFDIRFKNKSVHWPKNFKILPKEI